MSTAHLGELVQFYSGATPSKRESAYWGGNIPWFSPKDFKAPTLVDSMDHISQRAIDETSLRTLPTGTIAVVVRGMILAHTIPISILEVDCTINQDLKALLPRRKFNARYLAAMLRAQHDSILGKVSTAAHGTKKLDTRILEEIEVPLPSLQEQSRIVTLLERADAVRSARRRVLAHLDSLGAAVFDEMFWGAADRLWRIVPLRDVARRIESGTSPVCESRPAKPGEWGVLKLGAVTSGRYKEEDNKAYIGDVSRMSANEVRAGDVLMTRKNTRELVGAVAFVRETRPRLLIPDLVFRIRLDETQVHAQYFQGLMMNSRFRPRVRKLAGGAAASMSNISKARLGDLDVPVPPISLQREFASRVETIDGQRARVERALAADDDLFASLQHRAFRGEL